MLEGHEVGGVSQEAQYLSVIPAINVDKIRRNQGSLTNKLGNFKHADKIYPSICKANIKKHFDNLAVGNMKIYRY